MKIEGYWQVNIKFEIFCIGVAMWIPLRESVWCMSPEDRLRLRNCIKVS